MTYHRAMTSTTRYPPHTAPLKQDATIIGLAGLGNATFHPVDFTILNQRVSPPRLGYAFSAHGLTGNLGWAAAPVFFFFNQ